MNGLKNFLLFLQESKYFSCACKRCSSPTELGSHFSSILCQCQGTVTPTDSLDEESDWKCSSCGRSVGFSEVKGLVIKLEEEVSSSEVTIKGSLSLQGIKICRIFWSKEHLELKLLGRREHMIKVELRLLLTYLQNVPIIKYYKMW